jgi:hypothetical protein
LAPRSNRSFAVSNAKLSMGSGVKHLSDAIRLFFLPDRVAADIQPSRPRRTRSVIYPNRTTGTRAISLPFASAMTTS